MPGLKTVTLPPVIGKISEPSSSFASPTMPGVSLRDVRASTKPWSSLIAVVLPWSALIAATGFGADCEALEPSLSELLHAASGVATRAAMANAARVRLAVNFLVVLM